MKFKLIAILAILFISSLGIYSQTAEEIVDKSIIASAGSLDAYKNVNTTKMVAKMKVMGMEMGMTMQMKKPSFRLDQNVMGQKMVMVFDGKEAWSFSPGTNEVQILPAEQADRTKEQMNMAENQLLKYKEPGSKMEKLGKEKVDGLTCFKIKLTEKEGKVSTMFIDTDEYLVRKMISSNEGKEAEILLQDYKKYQNFNIPYKYVITAGEMGSMDIIIESMEFNIPIDDSIFKKPSK